MEMITEPASDAAALILTSGDLPRLVEILDGLLATADGFIPLKPDFLMLWGMMRGLVNSKFS